MFLLLFLPLSPPLFFFFLQATFHKGLKEYKAIVDAKLQKLGFKQKQDLKVKQKECKTYRAEAVGQRSGALHATLFKKRKERKKAAREKRRKSEAEAARIVAELESVEQRKVRRHTRLLSHSPH
jgi:hypothetical protein